MVREGDPRSTRTRASSSGLTRGQRPAIGELPHFYVLAHVAYVLPPVTCESRAIAARVAIKDGFTTKEQEFLGFVLSHYVQVRVEELHQEKLTPLLRLRYHNSIADINFRQRKEANHVIGQQAFNSAPASYG